MLDFDTVQDALEGLGSSSDAAEAHGTLCALLLDNAALATWLGQTLDELPDPGDVLATERLAVLEQLFEQTREGMNNADLAFAPLLPDESDDFGVRLLGIAEWCQGFLFGFGIVGAAKDGALDDAARECLSDLLEISKLSHDETGDDAAELQYVEIVEHLRMVTLLLNETLNPLNSPAIVH
ncbi:MAG: YecA family protein [Gammaproteobacteria bacterium]|nr:YecA family protein [Gammaproteobacteria bacterium]MDH3534329.1 YecA family protein [Gammaproteobacteria bacterium]